ncbi:hypothetical protein [Methylosinus sporium]|uniref:hypothetical protein n=1 Tax=Methylosinus sporium TaxID=428 RepID=UPI00383B5E5B
MNAAAGGSATSFPFLGKFGGQRTRDENQRIGEAMRMLGFECEKLRFGGKHPENCYVRGDATKRSVVERDGGHGQVYSVHTEEPDKG